MHWDVKLVQPLADYQIYVELENGQRGIFDLKPYLNQGVFQELQNIHYFNQVGIAWGAVTWPHEQDIAPDTLLAGLVPLEQTPAAPKPDNWALAFKLFGLVILKEDQPDHQLKRGAIGTIVEVFNHEAYEVDFIDSEGQTLALVTLTPQQLWPLTSAQCASIDAITQTLTAIHRELDPVYPDDPHQIARAALDRFHTEPHLKQQIRQVLQETGADLGLAAIEAALDHPAVTITMAGLKGFVET
jgi:hypothetical protein